MFNVYIKINEINYEKTAEAMLEKALKKWQIQRPEGRITGFLYILGDAALPALLGMLSGVTDGQKNELLYILSYRYEEELQAAISKFIEGSTFGNDITIGSVSTETGDDGTMLLAARGISVNYNGLVHSDPVRNKLRRAADLLPQVSFGNIGLRGLAAGGAAMFADGLTRVAPGQIEKKIISLVSQIDNKKKMLDYAAQILEEKGIYVSIQDVIFELVTEEEAEMQAREVRQMDGIIPEELEKALWESIGTYLRETILTSEREKAQKKERKKITETGLSEC
ncbi:hypothetical protein GPL15_18930 [Clostridium sp. MCC353]|uniref:hypothetical protein n=1 Tax=Clostridium sp. MCC353 TaxID=2592646 RepID=UPI001C02BF75|nr:hypothetical protein [Clostridium sp. MCC353]MBT9778576.1 hypothetical protein [Clostridium sp. MCC353]